MVSAVRGALTARFRHRRTITPASLEPAAPHPNWTSRRSRSSHRIPLPALAAGLSAPVTLPELKVGRPQDASRSTRELLPSVYDELRELARGFMRRERTGHTLQATALVHEAYLRLADQRGSAWQGRAQFFAVAARMIRRILVNHAKSRCALKRNGGLRGVALLEEHLAADSAELDLVELHERLEQLEQLDSRQARIVELRFFGGLSLTETAAVLGVSERTVSGEWTVARAWLRASMQPEEHR